MHRTCREKLFESSPTSPSRTFERGRRRQRSVWGQVLSQIKITLCNRRRGGPCGGAEGDGSEDLHTEYGVKSLSKPRRGGGRGHYLNVRVILIADNGYNSSKNNHITISKKEGLQNFYRAHAYYLGQEPVAGQRPAEEGI